LNVNKMRATNAVALTREVIESRLCNTVLILCRKRVDFIQFLSL